MLPSAGIQGHGGMRMPGVRKPAAHVVADRKHVPVCVYVCVFAQTMGCTATLDLSRRAQTLHCAAPL